MHRQLPVESFGSLFLEGSRVQMEQLFFSQVLVEGRFSTGLEPYSAGSVVQAG